MSQSSPNRIWVNIVTLLICVISSGASAQVNQKDQVIVGVYKSPPFVMMRDGHPTGMAIDLWEKTADDLGVDYVYEPMPTVRKLVDGLASGDVDVAVTNLTVTRKRADRADFTQPWFDAGQRILVNQDRGTGLAAVWVGLRDAGYLRAYGWLALVVVVATALLTVFDRRFNPEFPKRWPDGFAESFYSVMSVATSGRLPARKNHWGWIGRIMQACWLVCGIAVLAYVTSSVTSVMTTLSLTNQIHNINDLGNRTVGVIDGSVSEEFAREQGLRTRRYEDIDAAATGLLAGEVVAIVGDAPVLEYHVHINPNDPLDVVGPIFEPDKYAFALPLGSSLTRPLSLAILSTKENEDLEELRVKYFGDTP